MRNGKYRSGMHIILIRLSYGMEKTEPVVNIIVKVLGADNGTYHDPPIKGFIIIFKSVTAQKIILCCCTTAQEAL